MLHFVEHTCSASLECINVAAAPIAGVAKVERDKAVCASKVLSLFNQDRAAGGGAAGGPAASAASGKAGDSFSRAASGAAPSLPLEGGCASSKLDKLNELISPTRTELSSIDPSSPSSGLLGIAAKASRAQTTGGTQLASSGIRYDSEANPKAALLMSMKGPAPGERRLGAA